MSTDVRNTRARWALAGVAAIMLAVGVAWPAAARPAQDGGERPGPTAVPFEDRAGGTSSGAADAAGSAVAAVASGLTYSTVSPCRAFDSRQADGPIGFGYGYSLDLLTPCDLPLDGSVDAIMANVISVNAVGTGYVRSSAYDPTGTDPGATVLNFNNGLVSSNAVPLNVCVGCAYDIDIWVPSQSRTHIVLDVVGYFS